MSAEKHDTGHNTFNKSLEKGPTERVAPEDDRYHLNQSDLDRVQRRLKQRHVQMFVNFFAHMSIAQHVNYPLGCTGLPFVPSSRRRLQSEPKHLPQIAGTIGTGLFLGSGSALQDAGPAGALIAYLLVGTVAYSYVSLRSSWDPSLTRVQDIVLYR